MLNLLHFSKVFVGLIFLSGTLAQLPPINCSDIFQYVTEGSKVVGKITLTNWTTINDSVDLKVILEQPGSELNLDSARLYLSFNNSQKQAIFDLFNNEPITYLVDFAESNILPKVKQIFCNDVEICASENDESTIAKIKLKLKFKIPRSTSRNIRSTNFAASPIKDYSDNPFLPRQRQQGTTEPLALTFINPFTQHIAAGKNFNNAKLTPPNPIQSPSLLDTNCGIESDALAFTPEGTQLKRGQYPWLTAIYQKIGLDLRFLCTGTLISTRTVISAAHCFKQRKLRADEILLILGRNNLTNAEEEGSTIRSVKTLLIHPEYKSNATTDADIAILLMETPIVFSRFIAPICLWTEDIDTQRIMGRTALIAGWGADGNNDVLIPVPNKLEARIINDTMCEQQYARKPISTRTICAAKSDKTGQCIGSPGSGLMMFLQGRWKLRGIISTDLMPKEKCSMNDYFYSYDVAKHSQWIRNNL